MLIKCTDQTMQYLSINFPVCVNVCELCQSFCLYTMNNKCTLAAVTTATVLVYLLGEETLQLLSRLKG